VVGLDPASGVRCYVLSMTTNTEGGRMGSKEIMEKIASESAKGRKSYSIHAEDKDGHKYDIHVIAMPELSGGEINGTAAVSIDGKHYIDKTLREIAPIFDLMVSATIT